MQEIVLKGIDEKICYEKLDNGLPIYMLVNDKVNKLIEVLNSLNINNLTEVIIRVSDNGIMLILNGNIKLSEIEKLKDYVISIYLNNKEIYKKEDSYISLKGIKYKISANSFFQINHDQTINLYNQVKEYLGPNKLEILDLFSNLPSKEGTIYISSWFCPCLTCLNKLFFVSSMPKTVTKFYNQLSEIMA